MSMFEPAANRIEQPRMRAAQEAAQAVLSTLELDTVLDLILVKPVEILNAQAGTLLLVDGLPSSGNMIGDIWVFRAALGSHASALVGRSLAPGEGIAGTVLKTGTALIVNDLHADPRWKGAPDILAGIETQAALSIPLRSRDYPIGVLTIFGNTLFDEQDLVLMHQFCTQAAIALENASQYQKTAGTLERRLQELAAIEEIDRELGSTLDYDRIITLVLERAIEACGATSGMIGIVTASGLQLDTRAYQHEGRDSSRDLMVDRWPVDRGIVGRVVRSGQPALIGDVAQDPDYAQVIQSTRSEVVVPIRREDRVIGALDLESNRPNAFGQDDLHFMEHLAEHAAIAIENAHLFREERERVQTLAAIGEISRDIRAGLDLEHTLSLILNRVKDLVDYYIAEICLWDESQHALITWASAGDPRYTASTGGKYSPEEGFTGWIARNQRQLLVPDTTTRQDVQPKILSDDTPVRSYVGFPLQVGDTFVGTLELASDRAGFYTEDQVEILQVFADQAAVAIQSAQLFEEQQRQVRELGILFETSAAVSSSLELDAVLRTVAQQVARALEVSTCAISSWHPDRNEIRTLADEDWIHDPKPSDVGRTYRMEEYPLTAKVIASRQSMVVQASDPAADRAERSLMIQKGYKSLLMVPMVARDRVVGLAELFERRFVREFTDDDVRLCQALANLAASAIENARLYERTDERLQERVDQLTALQRTSEELNATLAQESILEVVLQSAMETTHATHGNVMLRDRETGLVTVQAAHGYSDEELASIERTLLDSSSRSLIAQVLTTGQPHIVTDATKEDYTVCVRPDTRSALIVPIMYEGEIVGLISLRHTETSAFDQDDLLFLEALAQQAAIAFGNALRFEEQVRLNTTLSHRTQQLDGLLEVSRKLRADVSLDDTLEEIAYAIQETVGFNIVLISILDNWESPEPLLRRAAAAGLPLDVFDEAKRVRQPLARYENILREEYRQGQCYFYSYDKIDDWGQDLHVVISMPDLEWQEGTWHPQDMLLAPLRGFGGRLLGHISVDEPRTGERPSHRTLEALAIFANQAAIAVENAKLYADAQHRADNLALINEIGRNLAQTLEPAHVLDTVVKGVGLLLECDLGLVFQLQAVDGRLAAVAGYGISTDAMAQLQFALGEGLVGQVAQTGIHRLVPDTGREAECAQWPIPMGSMMIVPISTGRQILGVLVAGFREEHRIAQSDRILLTTLADQAAVALDSARLFATTQQAAMRLASLNEIGRRIATGLELEDILETTVNSLHQYLGYYRVGVFLIDQEAGELFCAAANKNLRTLIPPGYREKVGTGLMGTAAATGETLLVADRSLDERFSQLDQWDSLSVISAPIQIGGHVVGVLQVEDGRRNVFSEEDIAALEIVADQLASAIEHARLFEAEGRRRREAETLRTATEALSSTLKLQEIFHLILSQLRQVVPYDSASVQQLDGTRLTIIGGQGYPRLEELLGWSFDIEVTDNPNCEVVQTRFPLILDDAPAIYEEFRKEPHAQAGIRSWMGIPLLFGDRLLGMITLDKREPGFYTEEHARLALAYAAQAAIAIQNAQLFEESERRVAELATVNEIGRALSSALDSQELCDHIYNQVSKLLDTRNFHIALYEPDTETINVEFLIEHGERQKPVTLKLRQGLTSYLIRTGQPILLHHGSEDFLREHNLTLERKPARSWLGVPMIAEGRVIGAIAVQSFDQEEAFDEGNLALLTTIAGQAAIAFQNAALFQKIMALSTDLERMVEVRTRDLEQALADLTLERDRVETLYRITSELGTSLELERVLQRALKLFADALGIQHGTITLLDQETGSLDVRATLEELHWRHRKGERTPLKEGSGLAGWVMENREPVLVPDVTKDDRWLEIPGKELEIRSVVAAPLSLGGGDILGVLTLGHTEVGHFTEEHLQLVTVAASQVAIAVNNSDLYAFITDQAERVGSMLQSQQAESAKNRAIVESIADGVLVLDHNGRVLLVNPAAEEMLGFSAMAIQGEHFRHMLGMGETAVHRDLAQSLYTELRRRLEAASQDASQVTSSTARVEAGKKVLMVNFAPLIIEVGAIPGLVAAVRDMSREAEVERLKNEFISTVSHELRTPMTSIKGYTDLLFLGMAGGLSDAQRNFLQIIKSNADRLTALVNDILDISRIETGRLRLTIESLDMAEIINQVVLSFKEPYRESDLMLEWKPPEGLPQVRGDAARITQVLNNLLGNAGHYTPAGGRVAVSVHDLDGFLQVDVEDTGIGIAQEDLSRIFDRFYRVDDPVVQEAGGTGLGLSIVKMFVEMLGGEIWVESELGVGSTFSFTLPMTTTEIPEEEAVQEADLITDAPSSIVRRPRVLVVEDDRDLALLLRRQLESEGYQVVLAGSGEDALWLAREEQPRLITLDLALPDMDGFSVLEQLKQHPLTAPIPVIIVSISSETEKGYALGAVDYVVKPFEEDKLLDSVRMALAPMEESQGGKLLVVDDDPDILGFLEKALSFHGYEVVKAANGQQALHQVRQERPDAILLDLKMPGIDGYEVIRRLKADESTRPIPIVVITASPVDKERDKVRVLGMGASHYMTKPLSIENLIHEIKTAMEERQS